jgi:hypothetical protein
MLKGHKWPRREARYMISLLGLRMVRSEVRIHALDRFHIGGSAYFVWALPPNAGGTAQRHIQVHSHTTSSITMSKQLLVK